MQATLQAVNTKDPIHLLPYFSEGDPVGITGIPDGVHDFDDEVYVIDGGKLNHVWRDVEGQMEMIFEGV